MEQKRDSWGSNLGFILAAVGSAVGLGNIWGFPYKMGKSGGFAFMLIYILLAIFVGFVIMMAELAMGRKTGRGTIGAYHALSKKFRWVGWLAVFSPFVILSFYTVLGGYCIEYMALNMSNLAFAGAEIKTGADLFGAMLVVGVMGHIAIQAILNIAVVTNSIPNTGISLPFISYGGSSALFLLSEIGLVLSVARRIQLKEL